MTPDERAAQAQVVERFSALTFQQFEQRVAVNTSPMDIVKFATPADSTYQTVVKFTNECVEVCYQLRKPERKLQERLDKLKPQNTSTRRKEGGHLTK